MKKSWEPIETDFINTIKSTSMSKSYKIPLLWAFYNNGNIKLKIDEDDIYNAFKEFYEKEENAKDLENQKSTQNYKNWSKKEYIKLAKDNPIKHLADKTSKYFYKENNLFCISGILEPYIHKKEFIQEYKDTIQSLENRYFKRETNNIKESDNKYMELKDLILSFEENYNENNTQDEKLRQEFTNKFPLDKLSTLEIERYALGKQPDNLCWWLEFNTVPLGSIKGGTAKKFKIYYSNKDNKWIYPSEFSNVEDAWIQLRKSIYDFIENFKYEKYELLNSYSLISSMNMFKTKLLYMYFPEKLLPIYSLDHIQKLLSYFGCLDEEIKDLNIIEANMKLKEIQDRSIEFKSWDGLKFMRFLYSYVFPTFNKEENINDEDIVEMDGEIIVIDIINKVSDYIKNQGYNYTYNQLSNLYLSLKTKPFTILAGISGTGKSKIIRLLADAIQADYTLISVRPDWNDATDLIGYKNLDDKFIKGQLTKAILKAQQNKNKSHLICLDEMNLARVEYYLSDYLSIIESRKKVGQDIITDNIVEYQENGENIKLHIPDNIYIIGTVNMDDTTFQFSRKVLDRANTIEFSDVDLDNLFFEVNEKVESLNVSNDFLKTTYLKTMDIEPEYREYAKEVNKKIIEINEILKKSQKQFAYRVRDEILFYLVENKKANLLHEDTAFDYQIMQKILPAISGSEESIYQVLIDLLNFVCETNTIDNIEEATNYLKETKVRYENSANKIIYMLKGYQNDGYVSYWY
ncbi:AAA domain-containing protein [Romboutsia ilealis]|uniref:AAA domain-containing protein n=1 Tax=Romboutsia ilealis TaxID=1115758 RepID=A0A1V1I034_9FIRM|nr:AAA family ATPase [Romboutsia ilealis]CED93602.1 AAA domain-containing protein [Romboutsia ilealis]